MKEFASYKLIAVEDTCIGATERVLETGLNKSRAERKLDVAKKDPTFEPLDIKLEKEKP